MSQESYSAGYIFGCVCYRIVKTKEFKLTYSESSESCAITALMNNLEPIGYKYHKIIVLVVFI